MSKYKYYKISGDKIERIKRNCPKCGDGVFLAEHKNRVSCGRCGYTEFKKWGDIYYILSGASIPSKLRAFFKVYLVAFTIAKRVLFISSVSFKTLQAW